MNANETLTTASAAQILDCEPSTVEDKLRKRELPGIKYGRSWVIPTAAFLAVINNMAMLNVRALDVPPAGPPPAPGRRRVPPSLKAVQ